MNQSNLNLRPDTGSGRAPDVSRAARHLRQQALLAQMQDQRKVWAEAISNRSTASAAQSNAAESPIWCKNWFDLNAVDWFNLARKHPWVSVASLGLAYAIGPKKIFNFVKFVWPYLRNK